MWHRTSESRAWAISAEQARDKGHRARGQKLYPAIELENAERGTARSRGTLAIDDPRRQAGWSAQRFLRRHSGRRRCDIAFSPTVALAPIDAVRITILMDNVTDPLLFPTEHVERTTWLHHLAQARAASAVTDDGLPDALIAEPGFSALVRVTTGGRERTILFDAGVTPDRCGREHAPARARAGRRSRRSCSATVTGTTSPGWRESRRSSDARNLPVLIHPDFWRRRRIAIPGLEPAELPATSRSALEGAGFEIVEERQPSFLLDGSVLVTGEVDRTTPFETGFLGHEAHVHGSWEPDPLILDDQAIVMRLAGRGLVVLTGCGHAGIVSVVRHAQRLHGRDGASRPSSVGSTSAARCSSRSSSRRSRPSTISSPSC